MIEFLGRGCGFADEHTSALFRSGSDLVLIDCSMTAFIKLKSIWDQKKYAENIHRIVIAVTHTHSDHIGGISMLIFYAFYMWKIPVLVIAPSKEVAEDLKTILCMEGCNLLQNGAEITWVGENTKDTVREDFTGFTWLKCSIPTSHTVELQGKCFGYELQINEEHIIYTGDSNSLEAFMAYLTPGSVLLTECAFYSSTAHTHVDKIIALSDWFKEHSIRVYLMHLDNEEELSKLTKPVGYSFAPLIQA